jgi:ACS family hexuronate transporter-like MFS transporter
MSPTEPAQPGQQAALQPGQESAPQAGHAAALQPGQESAPHAGHAAALQPGQESAPQAGQEAQPSPLRWRMIQLCFWATVINYLDRQTLSVAAPTLKQEFGMTDGDYSRVVFAFLLAYTISNGLSGGVIDRLGTKIGYALCVGVWSAAAALHALARGAFSLGAYRFLLGIGEAGNWPGAVKVVSEWFPKKERALASGIFNSGSAVGAILGPPVVGLLVLHLGWQSAFLFVGLTGFIWMVAWFFLYRTPAEVVKEEASGPPVSIWSVLRTRFVWSFTLSKVFMDPVWYFYTFWFFVYLAKERGFDLKATTAVGWIPFAVAGLGNIFGGLLAKYLLNKGWSTTVARKTAVTVFAVSMMAGIPAVLVDQVWLSIVLVSVAMAGYTGSLANMLAFPADVFPKNVVASVYGIASMGAGFGGMLFTLITGWVLDTYKSYTPVFIGFGIMPLICAAMLWFLVGPLKRVDLPGRPAETKAA